MKLKIKIDADDPLDSNLVMKPPHELHIHTPESMTSGSQEVEADVDPVVRDGHTVHPRLCLQEDVKLLVNVLDDGLPAISVVHTVTKTYNESIQ